MRIETVGPISLVEGAVVELDMIIIFIFYRVVDSSKNSLNWDRGKQKTMSILKLHVIEYTL